MADRKETIDNPDMGTDDRAMDDSDPIADQHFAVTLPPESDTESGFISGDEVITSTEPPTGESLDDAPDLTPDQYRGRLSDDGTPYDPDVHSFPPSQTKAGKWRKRRGGGAKQAGDNPSTEYRREAENMAIMYAMLHPVLLGPDARLEDRAELIPLVDALERVLHERGLSDIPPELAAVVAAASYSAGVVQRPTVWERFTGLLSKAVSLVKGKTKKDDDR